MEAPRAQELRQNPIVIAALDAAWRDSHARDPANRHEEGGWVFLDPSTGIISITRAPSGGASAIDLDHPPDLQGLFVVGKFHTHPNPTSEGWDPGPSQGDMIVDEIHGVPDLIRSDAGDFLSGPESRRGGLTGNLGYPMEDSGDDE